MSLAPALDLLRILTQRLPPIEDDHGDPTYHLLTCTPDGKLRVQISPGITPWLPDGVGFSLDEADLVRDPVALVDEILTRIEMPSEAMKAHRDAHAEQLRRERRASKR